jgi:hypothetical protein
MQKSKKGPVTEAIEKSVISILGLEKMPLADQFQILTQVSELVQRRLMLRILEELDDNAVKVFSELIDNKQEDKIIEYVEEHIPNFYQILEQEVNQVKVELKEMVDGLDV